jgi:hypothetical protein
MNGEGNAMTDASTIIPGAKIGSWEIPSVDPTGRRACASCSCGVVRILSIGALLDGSVVTVVRLCAAFAVTDRDAAP